MYSIGNAIQDGEKHQLIAATGYNPYAGAINGTFTFTFDTGTPGENPSCRGQVKAP